MRGKQCNVVAGACLQPGAGAAAHRSLLQAAATVNVALVPVYSVFVALSWLVARVSSAHTHPNCAHLPDERIVIRSAKVLNAVCAWYHVRRDVPAHMPGPGVLHEVHTRLRMRVQRGLLGSVPDRICDGAGIYTTCIHNVYPGGQDTFSIEILVSQSPSSATVTQSDPDWRWTCEAHHGGVK